jgi:hypothetical protein
MIRQGNLKMKRTGFTLLAVVAGLGGSLAVHAQTLKTPPLPNIVTLTAQPAALTLTDSRDRRSVLVTGKTAAGDAIDLTPVAKFRVASGIAQVDAEGTVVPLKAGKTTLIVTAAGQTIRVPVTITSAKALPVSFLREVMPILSKAGCNAGTCHGAAKGKNGFRLSLRGYDPDFDYLALVADVLGRRINRADPAQSLMLLKPTGAVPHKGGVVLTKGSRAYQLLERWIAQGAPNDTGTAKRVVRLEALPAVPNLTLPGRTQKTLVIAHYSDGATRDVTREAIFTSSMPEIATTTPDGTLTAKRRGEAALLVRYEGNYAATSITVLGDRTGYQWTPLPQFNYIDRLVDAKLKKIKALPSAICDDATYLRRVSLDLTGLPPTPEQTRAFLADRTPSQTKRARLVERLLASPDYVERWTNKWADLLNVNSKYLGDRGAHKFREWLRSAIATNMPYDRFVHTLLTASGDAYQNPAVSYLRVSRDTSLATENITQLFLGVRFSCNKCHDHPFERWTQKQYYQFGANFAQIGYKPGGERGSEVVYNKGEGETIYPRTNLAVAPEVPVGRLPKTDPTVADRRAAFSQWLTTPENPFFSRALINRLWSYFFGKGIIDPVDDIRASNPPSNPELLEALNKDFVQGGFDMKRMMRTMVLSRVYQSSIATNKWNEDDTMNFSHALPRRLEAEQLLDAIHLATGTTARFAQTPTGAGAKQLVDAKVAVPDDYLLNLPEKDLTEAQKAKLAGARAAAQAASFLSQFGRPPRESPCECERTSNVSLGQTLTLVNGPTISDAIASPTGRIARLAQRRLSDRQVIEEVFLAALARYPTPKELQNGLKHFKASANQTEAAQDLMWALLNSPAFLFNR